MEHQTTPTLPPPSGTVAASGVPSTRHMVALISVYVLQLFNEQFMKQAMLLMATRDLGPEWQGYLQTIFYAPFVLLAFLAGWLADSFSKRSVVIAVKAGELLTMILCAAGIYRQDWVLLCIGLGLLGIRATIFGPAQNGSIPDLCPTDEAVLRANGVIRIFTTASLLLGIAMAGFMLAMKQPGLGPMTFGQSIIALGAIGIAAVGLGVAFFTYRKPAAKPGAPFPKDGPGEVFRTLARCWKDPLLGKLILGHAVFLFVAAALIPLINALGMRQFGYAEDRTSLLVVAEVVGVAIGGVLCRFIVRGDAWYRVLAPSALGVGIFLILMIAAPGLPVTLRMPVMLTLLTLAGMAGGIFLIPLESYVQARPAAAEKGAVLAAANFCSFSGILLSGPGIVLLFRFLTPAQIFPVLGGIMLLLCGWLIAVLPKNPNPHFPEWLRTIVDPILRALIRGLLWLRYDIRVSGLEEIRAKGRDGILFLPNHSALIDPVIMLSVLHGDFRPRAVADQQAVDLPGLRTLVKHFGVRTMPDLGRHGKEAQARVETVIQESTEGLRQGECVLIYPAGRLMLSQREELGARSGPESLIRGAPDARVVLVRMRGLWGSSFGRVNGDLSAGKALLHGGLSVLANFLFFTPRRRITIELVEPADFPRQASRLEINHYLEAFYNIEPLPRNTYVPYTIWEKGGTRELPEPRSHYRPSESAEVSSAIRESVTAYLLKLTGAKEIRDNMRLSIDLGLDSLAQAELMIWLNREFAYPDSATDSLHTVADVMLAAAGEAVAMPEKILVHPAPESWFASPGKEERLRLPEGDTIPQLFLQTARSRTNRVLFAEQGTGARTYRDIITGIFALLPKVRALPGERIGIMLPASTAAGVTYLTALFAGKTPVLLNWTVGRRNLQHALELAEISAVLTSQRLVAKLEMQGLDLSNVKDRLVSLEALAQSLGKGAKLRAWLQARVGWGSLERAQISPIAAILFTSGSESLPKAVPLTQTNILSNIRSVFDVVELRNTDRLLGMLPPFHSFGLTATIVMPICSGLPTVYHPNPTEGATLAKIIENYRATLLIGTPTFLSGIARAAAPEQLATLRRAVTGAEECPARVYALLAERCPKAVVLEGYGITECSPIVALNDENAPRQGAIGKPLPCVQYAVVDIETNQRVVAGKQGMLLVRGPSIFGGYLGDAPSPFVEFEGQSWYRTGDLVCDEDGVLLFKGRLKRFVKIGGEMVSLPAIESCLLPHFSKPSDDGPALAVTATPDGERPELVLFTTRPVDRDEVNQLIRAAGLSALHNIRHNRQLDAIPVLGTGKTDYRALQAMLNLSDFPLKTQKDANAEH